MTAPSASERVCPKCRAPIPIGSAEGLCPACLFSMNLATQTDLTDQPGQGPHGTRIVEAPPVLPPAPEAIAPFFPQLEILACLGRGGMGIVYQARQKTLDRLVALKLLAPEREKDPAFAARFQREAQALARLNHPNIVTIHDFGQAGGFYFLLMEYVDGVNLRQLLESRKLSPEEALAIVPPLCDALQYAHERGIVHRDIKPENLLLDRAGRVKVADFGIAKLVGDGRDLNDAPGSGGDRPGARHGEGDATRQTVAGTPGYMAPEQQALPQLVDSRADIYSLGVVFYEMLTGERPAARIEPPSRKVQIDVRLDQIVLRALEKTPELRWQTAAELRTQIETMVATPPPTMQSASPHRHASRGVLVGLLAFVLVTTIVALISLSLPKVYQAKARLENVSPDAMVSRAVIERVSDELGLADRWAKGAAMGTVSEEDVSRRLKNSVALRQAAGSEALTVLVTSERLIEAEEIANELARAASTVSPGARIVALADGTGQLIAPDFGGWAAGGVVSGLLVGTVLGWFYTGRSRRRSAQVGPSPPLHLTTAPGLALALVVASMLVPLAAGTIFQLVMRVQRANELREEAVRQDAALRAVAVAQRQVDELTRRWEEANRSLQDSSQGEPRRALAQETANRVAAEKAEAEEELASAARRAKAATVRFHSEVRPGLLFLLPALLFGIPGTVLAWRHLVSIRSIPPPRPGVILAFVAALFWPLLLASAVAGAVVLLPLNHGVWANLGLSLAVLAIVFVNVWSIRRGLAWLRRGQPAALGLPGSRFVPDGTPRPVGAVLLVLAVVIPVAWIAAVKGESTRMLRLWHQQMSGLQKEWTRATTQRFEAQTALDRHSAIVANLPRKPSERAAAEQSRRELTRALGQAEARVATLDARMQALNELQAADRARAFQRQLPALFIGPALGMTGLFLLRRAKRSGAGPPGFTSTWVVVGIAVVMVGVGGLILLFFATARAPVQPTAATDSPISKPARIVAINHEGGTARIGTHLDGWHDLVFHLGEEGNGWFSRITGLDGDYVTLVVPSSDVPVGEGKTEPGFILRTYRGGDPDNPVGIVNVASSGTLLQRGKLILRKQPEEEWDSDGAWLTFADLVEEDPAGNAKSIPLTARVRKAAPMSPSSSPASIPSPIDQAERRVLQTQYEKTLSELLEAEKERELLGARTDLSKDVLEQQSEMLQRKIRILTEQQSALRRQLESQPQ